ncbi:hypothetical protein [Rhodococcus sp. MEB032]|uniref:hypothetical protein n=1 Tax=Rhodococcus sp. MEB032 TaxID=3040322 RepID=UPI00254CE3CA|nr:MULTISPECIES: hypothetical protein [Rhodococcus]
MTPINDELVAAQTAFELSINKLAAQDPNAAIIVLTMGKLVAEHIAVGDARPSASRTIRTETKARRVSTPRAPAALDPFAAFRSDGEDGLRKELGGLDLEQLRDILHQYGLDPDKRSMKWKTAGKVRERIVERVRATSTRDNAFR